MNSREKAEWYEDMISDITPMAAVIGRREPYHLTYLKRYNAAAPPPEKTGCGGEDKAESGEVKCG